MKRTKKVKKSLGSFTRAIVAGLKGSTSMIAIAVAMQNEWRIK